LPIEEVLFTAGVVLALGAIVTAANIADRDQSPRARIYVVMALLTLNVLVVAWYGILQVVTAYSPATGDFDPPERSAAWDALAGSLIVAGLATIVLARPARERLAVLFPRSQEKAKRETGTDLPEPVTGDGTESDAMPAGRPLFPQMLDYYTTGSQVSSSPTPAEPWPGSARAQPDSQAYQPRGFNPASSIHTVALTLCVYLVGLQMVAFILEGGLGGVAETYENGLSGWQLIVSGLPFVVVPVLGVGIGLRRNGGQVLKRLGLGVPTPQGVGIAVGMTIALLIFVGVVNVTWMGLVSEETYQEQTQAAEALSDSVTTLGLAFMLAITAAVSEEIAFRGALQPVFGYWPTAIIFALTHSQYALTPAWFVILVVALGFGWIRMRFNTTTAMLTHFMYNFIPLALTVYAPEEAFGTILRLL
jgi:membrane protease YdiL (CAAX protease family)